MIAATDDSGASRGALTTTRERGGHRRGLLCSHSPRTTATMASRGTNPLLRPSAQQSRAPAHQRYARNRRSSNSRTHCAW
eukprot:11167040-Lingulodinium_polyedra.AAC.1